MCTAISLQKLRNLAEGQLTLAIGEPRQCEDDLNGDEDGDDVDHNGDYIDHNGDYDYGDAGVYEMTF